MWKLSTLLISESIYVTSEIERKKLYRLLDTRLFSPDLQHDFMPIHTDAFGTLPSGETVHIHTLVNRHGLRARIIDLGGIVTELHVPDRKGNTADVALGFDRLEPYLAKHPYFGALVGRVAGRITRGKFTLDEKDYQLAITDPPNHLHGGVTGFDKRLWSPRPYVNEHEEPTLILQYHSPDGEEGYPGNLQVEVKYVLTNDNALRIEYDATTDKATPFSPTNHSYFNLAGEGSGDALQHVLQIFCEECVPAASDGTLTGKREPVSGSVNDFIAPRVLADAVPKLARQHGENYIVPEIPGLVLVARLEDPGSGRVLETFTTENSLQFYTGMALNGSLTGKSGRPYGQFAGVCLECQGYPDGVMQPEFGSIVLEPGSVYRQTTIYRFSTAR